MIWDLSGQKAQTVYNSYNTAIKMIWSVPRNMKTFLVQKVLAGGHTSAKTDIISRYGRFFQSLLSSASEEVRLLSRLVARDMRTVTAKNLDYVKKWLVWTPGSTVGRS